MNKIRRIIMAVSVVSFDESVIAKVHIRYTDHKIADRFYFLNSDMENISFDNDMSFDTFRNILSQMKTKEIYSLKKHIKGRDVKSIVEIVNNELRRRHMPLVEKKNSNIIKVIDLLGKQNEK